MAWQASFGPPNLEFDILWNMIKKYAKNRFKQKTSLI